MSEYDAAIREAMARLPQRGPIPQGRPLEPGMTMEDLMMLSSEGELPADPRMYSPQEGPVPQSRPYREQDQRAMTNAQYGLGPESPEVQQAIADYYRQVLGGF